VHSVPGDALADGVLGAGLVAGGETDGVADEELTEVDGLVAEVPIEPVPVVAEAHPPTSTAAPAARSANRSDMWPSSWLREGA
jgi:hypothetical protein